MVFNSRSVYILMLIYKLVIYHYEYFGHTTKTVESASAVAKTVDDYRIETISILLPIVTIVIFVNLA